MNMIISYLCGGLGNQMFQYAAGRALSLRTGVPLLLDTSWYLHIKGATQRNYILDVFPIQAEIASPKTIHVLQWKQENIASSFLRRMLRKPRPRGPALVEEPHFHYWPDFIALTPPVYLKGYWQSEQYFLDYSALIKQEFTFPPLPAGQAQELKQNIDDAQTPVAVHIRRGDYVQVSAINAIHGVCSSSYYASAITHIKKENPSAFLFSDDPAWVQEHFDTQGLPATVVDLALPAEPWHDMHLISLCRHHIIANSSFSWWGAWLGEKGGMVCAPKLWFANSEWQQYSPCPTRWLVF